MRKVNKKRLLLVIVTGLILICLLAFGIVKGISYVMDNSKSLELVGNGKHLLMLDSAYQDLGVNIPEAEMEGKVDTTKSGTYKLRYTYKKQKVTRTVEVLDNKQIVMNLNGSAHTYVKQNQKYIESGCHAIDKTEGNLTDKVKIEGNVDTSKPGKYEVVYKVKNKQGVECSRKRIVQVVSDQDFKENVNGIPVMMYHYVYTKEDAP